MDTPKYVELSNGFYADPDDDTIVVINPVEILDSEGVEVTQESIFAVYANVLREAKDRKVEVVLITEEGIPSTAEMIADSLAMESEHKQVTYADDEPEDKPTEVDPHSDAFMESVEGPNSEEEIEEEDTTVMITSDEYTGPERRRMPR